MKAQELMMKNLIIITCFVASLFVTANCPAKADLVKDPAIWLTFSQNPHTIICQDNPSEPMTFAVSELQQYLQRILVTYLSNASSDKDTPRIKLCICEDAELSDEVYEISVNKNQ